MKDVNTITRFFIIIVFLAGLISGFLFGTWFANLKGAMKKDEPPVITQVETSEGITEYVENSDGTVTETKVLTEIPIEEETFDYGTVLTFPDSEWKMVLPKSFVKQEDGSFYSDTYKYSIQYRKFDGTTNEMLREKGNNPLLRKLGIDTWNDNYGDNLYSGFCNTENSDESVYVGIDDSNESDYTVIKIIKVNPNEVDFTKNVRRAITETDADFKTDKEKILSDIDYYFKDKGSGYWEKTIKDHYLIDDISYNAVYNYYNGQFKLVAIYYYGFDGYQAKKDFTFYCNKLQRW